VPVNAVPADDVPVPKLPAKPVKAEVGYKELPVRVAPKAQSEVDRAKQYVPISPADNPAIDAETSTNPAMSFCASVEILLDFI